MEKIVCWQPGAQGTFISIHIAAETVDVCVSLSESTRQKSSIQFIKMTEKSTVGNLVPLIWAGLTRSMEMKGSNS